MKLVLVVVLAIVVGVVYAKESKPCRYPDDADGALCRESCAHHGLENGLCIGGGCTCSCSSFLASFKCFTYCRKSAGRVGGMCSESICKCL